jgi:PadR family transcriptional regulator PadR
VIYNTAMIDKKISSDLLRGHTDTIILKLLTVGDKYGYEITKLVYEYSSHLYELKEATMYSSLKRLENDEHITSYWGSETQGGRRKYYRITKSGQDLYKVNKQNWEWAKHILDELL